MLQLVLLASMAQNPAPSIEPMSFYGMRTYANQANFGFLSESWHLVMAPASYESMTFHLKKGDQELVTYGHYFDDTPWPAFRLARLQYPAPIWLEQEGEYVAEYRLDGKVISAFPFTITKKSGGDAYNPTTAWSFKTPIDRMGQLHVDQASDGPAMISFMMHPAAEGIAKGSNFVAKITHNGRVMGVTPTTYISEPHNQRYWTRLHFDGPNGRGEEFNWSDLAKLTGTIKIDIEIGTKVVRSFTYTATAPGTIKGHPRSELSYSPASGHYPPRRIFGETGRIQMHHVWWADSK